MLIHATEHDHQEILDYLLTEPEINTYLLADIHYYGLQSDAQDVWVQRADSVLCGVLLRYYEDYLYYTRDRLPQTAEVQRFLEQRQAKAFAVCGRIAEGFAPLLADYIRHSMQLCRLESDTGLVRDTEAVVLARAVDAPMIAAQYMKIDELVRLYQYDAASLAGLIATRIDSGEGEHMYLMADGVLAAHGNSGGKAEKSAFINGIFTLPAYRGRGYAAKVVSALCKRLLCEGRTPVLSFDNPDAGRLYYKLGFTDIDKWVIFTRKMN